MTRSALIRGELMHARHDEVRRTFTYPVYVAAIDLDELPALDRDLRLFSHGGRNLFALHDRDYRATLAPATAAPVADLRASLATLLAGNGLPAPHTTRLVTNLRVLGYVFNPVSFFLNYDAAGALSTVVAEVNNTYGGSLRYVLGPGERVAGERIGFRHVRELYVSPFLHGPAHYDFWFDAPLDAAELAIEMHVARPSGSRTADGAGLGRAHAAVGPRATRRRDPLPVDDSASHRPDPLRGVEDEARGRGVSAPGWRSSADPTDRVRDPYQVTCDRVSGADVAHPLIVPLPRLVPPAGHALRWLALQRLRAGWTGAPLDLVMPAGDRIRLGAAGPRAARVRIHDDRVFLRCCFAARWARANRSSPASGRAMISSARSACSCARRPAPDWRAASSHR